jgi:hypothetical protein
VTAGTIWLAVELVCALLVTVGGGQVAVWAAFLVIAPITVAIYRWRWRRAVREYPG